MNKSLIAQIPKGVTLVAVTKTVSVDVINEALREGISDIGENRVQIALDKFKELILPCQKHLIGHLQTNKVKEAVMFFDYIHSVDSLRIAIKINEQCLKQNKRVKVFFELNLSGEKSKFGFTKEEFEKEYTELLKLRYFEPIGLMTMAPFYDNPEETRPLFRELKKLAVRYNLPETSMGMSNDYKVAIDEGSTFVRIGTAVFN